MKKILTALITLKAVDKMSATVNKAYGNAKGKLQSLARRSAKFAGQAGNMAASAGLVAAGIATALSVPINKAMEFEQAVADVGAVMRDVSEKDMAAMSAKAREMGRTTQFTAVESAQAMQFLAMAGFDASKSMAALPGVLNLAAAGNLDLAKAADISSDILSAFKLDVSEIARVNDVLAGTATTANTNVEMLGETMKYAAPVAATLGQDIETVAAMAGKLANEGIKGQQAGTGLRAIMLRLSAPAKKGKKALAELGVSATDMAGNLKDMPNLLGEIGQKIKDLPTGKKAQLIKDIFGVEASSAASILLTQAQTGALQEYIGTVSKRGVAEAVAAKRMATTKGAMLRLKSAGEELMIVAGNALLPMVADFAEKLAVVAQRVAGWAEANPKLFKTIVKVVAVVGAVLGALAVVGTVVAAVASAVSFLSTVFSVIATVAGVVAGAVSLPFVLIGAAIAAAAILIYKYWDEIKAFFVALGPRMLTAGKNIVTSIGKGIKAALVGPYSPYGLMKAGVEKVRNLLPFSPAKDGPLRDIHKIKLVETIAGSIKAKPLVSAMTGVVGKVANIGAGGGAPALSSGPSGGFNYSPTVTFNGPVTESTKQDFAQMLAAHKAEIKRMMAEIYNDKKRLAY